MRHMNPLDPGNPQRYGDPDLEGRYGQRRLSDFGPRVIWCIAGVILMFTIIAIVAVIV